MVLEIVLVFVVFIQNSCIIIVQFTALSVLLPNVQTEKEQKLHVCEGIMPFGSLRYADRHMLLNELGLFYCLKK